MKRIASKLLTLLLVLCALVLPSRRSGQCERGSRSTAADCTVL